MITYLFRHVHRHMYIYIYIDTHTYTSRDTCAPIRPIGAVAEASLDVPKPQGLPSALIIRTTSLISGMEQTNHVTSSLLITRRLLSYYIIDPCFLSQGD